MWPTLKPGDLCYISDAPALDGEIVCLRDQQTKELIIHRQLGHDGERRQVKGDNALYWDDTGQCRYIGVVRAMQRGHDCATLKPNLIMTLLSPYTSKRSLRPIRVITRFLMRLIA